MKDAKAKVLSNEKVARDFYKIALEAPGIAREAKPGQFVMVKCSESTDPLLRRPFSFHKINKQSFELLYKVVGKGTEILSKRKKGEGLDVLGPLGNGFNILSAKSVILVGGGTGIAPLSALANQFTAYPPAPRLRRAGNLKLTAFIGARTKDHIVCIDEFKKLGAEMHISTEDGSKSHKGLVTDLLRRRLTTNDYRLTTIYACGPRPMLEEVAKIAKSKELPCQVSLEERMACGTGACLGCALKTKTGYKMVCKDGPIFDARDIIW